MNVLVLGGGGREHALAWKLAQSNKINTVFVAPGNAGTAIEPKIKNISESNTAELIEFCRDHQISFTLVGPEAPLAAGVVDDFNLAGLPIFGPTQYCAQLEGSKTFAKEFMEKYHIPTAKHQTFERAELAHEYLNQKKAPIVIKADGLAAGKGVVVALSLEEAHQAVDEMLLDHKFGKAGASIVIEDFLQGEEASFIVMVDGNHVLPMASSQDHKRLLNDDKGPNTGGMGAYSPAPVVTPEVHQRVMDRIIMPAVEGMKAEGHPYTGFLYAGLMIDHEGNPYTIEFNCRFGDPETQPIMARLESDLVDLIEAALKKQLNTAKAQWRNETAIGVVLAAGGYPESPKTGEKITGIEEAEKNSKVFHAGTLLDDEGNIISSGGRVLCVVGLGNDVQTAQEIAYQSINNICFQGMQYRTDIGDKAIEKLCE